MKGKRFLKRYNLETKKKKTGNSRDLYSSQQKVERSFFMKAAEKMSRERELTRQRQEKIRHERRLQRRRLQRKRYRIALCLRAVTVLTVMTLALFLILWGRAQLTRLFSDEAEAGGGDFTKAEEQDAQLGGGSLPGASADGGGGSYEDSDQRQRGELYEGNGQSQNGELPFDLSDPLLLLVNKDNPLPEDYEVALQVLPSGLVSVAKVLYDDLEEMLADGKKEGLQFVVCSGYRSAQRQQELLDEDIRSCMARGMSYEEAYEEVTRMTMPPGCSEHSTGLALDIVALSYQLLDEGQERTAENEWLRENAWQYGFILRYPEGQGDVTGIDYESWHFRYVGREAAQLMHEQELLLEEVWGS